MALIALTLPNQQFFDNDGVVVAGGFLYTFIAGSSTPQDTYLDSSSTANSNPIELDASGRAVIYVPATPSLKLVLKDANQVTVWTQDNVSPAELA